MSDAAASTLAQELESYEVQQSPVMNGARLGWAPWVRVAVSPYEVTRLPHVTVVGLWDALRRAEACREDVSTAAATPSMAKVVELNARRVGQRAGVLAAVN